MKVLTVVGARPQFIKAAPVRRALDRAGHREFLVHTGQHYDDNMSQVFFRELGIPEPEVNLGVGSGPHGRQTAQMLTGLEEVIVQERPDWVLVYGDTNSTLAGALAAAKIRAPLAHVEAGLRSFNRGMPEEVNRVVADRLSDLLLCPSEAAVRNLAAEGMTQGVHRIGDVMADALEGALDRARRSSRVLSDLGLAERGYALATLHRAENTDRPERLRGILEGLGGLGETVVLPLHPRTRKVVETSGASLPPGVRAIPPQGYLDMVRLVASARIVLTDSGGLQKEAYWLGVPCVTLREETEWVETVEAGWNVLAGSDPERVARLGRTFRPPEARPELYGDGHAAERCVALLAAGIPASPAHV